MKIISFDRYSCYIGNERLDSFLATAFHGLAKRERESGQLQLTVNRWNTHYLTTPEANGVIRAAWIPDFSLPGVSFRECDVLQDYFFEVRFGDFTHWDDPKTERLVAYPKKFFDDTSTPSGNLGETRHELRLPQLGPVPSGATGFTVKLRTGRLTENTVDFCAAQFERHPLCGSGLITLCREDIWSQIEKYINPDAYLIQLHEL